MKLDVEGQGWGLLSHGKGDNATGGMFKRIHGCSRNLKALIKHQEESVV